MIFSNTVALSLTRQKRNGYIDIERNDTYFTDILIANSLKY
jgi:hypothetical protein